MSRKIWRSVGERAGDAATRARAWLRRVMPRVGIASPLLLALWLLARRTSLYQNSFVGDLFGFVVFLVVCSTIVYYGLRALLWLKRKLLWRVRRRLIITYLFIGLTPIILLGMLGMLSALVGLGQALTRIVAVQVNTTESQTLSSARALADSYARLPADTNDRQLQQWLDERAALLRGSLPGARVALWREGDVADVSLGRLGLNVRAQFASEPAGERERGVGGDTSWVGEPLPAWLENRAEWSAFAFVPPAADSVEPFGSPSVRALVRREASNDGRGGAALLLVVPVSRALVEQLRQNGGVRLSPFFLGADQLEARTESGGIKINVSRQEDGNAKVVQNAERDKTERLKADFNRDQLGEPLGGQRYVVILPATNWQTGVTDQRLSFMFNFSLVEAGQQILGSSEVGQVLRQVLLVTAGVFLFLELIALFAAGWMTRAVTGTVHKLYRATEYIKHGDFSHRVNVRSHDQLGELATAFNEMSANIESLLKERVERERLEREVEIAAEVQAQLFPRSVPELSTLEIAAECRAARGVAGDYYDYIEVAPGIVAFALGDVSGKGISASLVMSNLQASLRAQTTIIAERMTVAGRALAATAVAGGVDTSVAGASNEQGLELPCGVTDIDRSCAVEQMVSNINTQLCHSTDANRFATFFLALYNDRTRLLRYTNAGHNDAIIVRAGGTLERLSIGGTVVGAFDWAAYEEGHTALAPGDLLLIFSDGLSEAQNVVGEEYGEARLTQFTAQNRSLSADELRRAIFQEVDDWSGAQERGDDQTLVILKAVAGGEKGSALKVSG